MNKYSEKSARELIKRNSGKVGVGMIKIKNPGIKTLGAIDYLVKVHKYYWNQN